MHIAQGSPLHISVAPHTRRACRFGRQCGSPPFLVPIPRSVLCRKPIRALPTHPRPPARFTAPNRRPRPLTTDVLFFFRQGRLGPAINTHAYRFILHPLFGGADYRYVPMLAAMPVWAISSLAMMPNATLRPQDTSTISAVPYGDTIGTEAQSTYRLATLRGERTEFVFDPGRRQGAAQAGIPAPETLARHDMPSPWRAVRHFKVIAAAIATAAGGLKPIFEIRRTVGRHVLRFSLCLLQGRDKNDAEENHRRPAFPPSPFAPGRAAVRFRGWPNGVPLGEVAFWNRCDSYIDRGPAAQARNTSMRRRIRRSKTRFALGWERTAAEGRFVLVHGDSQRHFSTTRMARLRAGL